MGEASKIAPYNHRLNPPILIQTMRLLLSNDDGIYALGIRTLANCLVAAGHHVTVVSPDGERSATGHGLTLHDPIRADPVTGVFAPEIAAWACSGTPADCVKLGLGAILEAPPDFVLAGINHGPNLGTDVIYSGTVSAAMEGNISGIPSLAFSLGSYTSREFQPAADFAVSLLAQLKAEKLPPGVMLSVNVPAVAADQIRGARLTRQGIRHYDETWEKRKDPRGRTYFWLAGEAIEDMDHIDAHNPHHPDRPPTDVQMIQQNYITLTPLHYDWTCYEQADSLPQVQL